MAVLIVSWTCHSYKPSHFQKNPPFCGNKRCISVLYCKPSLKINSIQLNRRQCHKEALQESGYIFRTLMNKPETTMARKNLKNPWQKPVSIGSSRSSMWHLIAWLWIITLLQPCAIKAQSSECCWKDVQQTSKNSNNLKINK